MAEWCALADVAVRALPGRAFVSAGAASADHAAFHHEVLRWQEMTGRYPGAHIRLLPGSDHALSDFDDHLPFVLEFLKLCD